MNHATIDRKKLKEIKFLQSDIGKTADSLCIMQAVDYVTGGQLSDHPDCVCPVLTSFAIRVNDAVSEDIRQTLKPLIPKLVNTRSDDTVKIKRAKFLAHQAVVTFLPILTNALGLKDITKTLKTFKVSQLAEAAKYIRSKREEIKSAATYAATAYAAAATAAYAAYYADAAAADAATAAATAADAAAADADAAADGATDAVKKWQKVRQDIHKNMVKVLKKAIEIK